MKSPESTADPEMIVALPYSQFVAVLQVLQSGPHNLVWAPLAMINAQLAPQIEAWRQRIQAETVAMEAAALHDTRPH